MLRWREWMGRIEVVLFASSPPVGRDELARVVGQGASVEMLIDDIQTELMGRPYELMESAGGWMFRTRPSPFWHIAMPLSGGIHNIKAHMSRKGQFRQAGQSGFAQFAAFAG